MPIKPPIHLPHPMARSTHQLRLAQFSNEKMMRPIKHVGDVGDLVKLVMVKEGKRHGEAVDAKLRHELSDCLWSLLIIADHYGIDLEQSFFETMNELDERLASK